MPEWDAARAQARAELVARARARSTVTYLGLCVAIAIARFRAYSWSFMALLDEACREEDAATGTILASLVVRRDTGMPGEGYFAWAGRAGYDVTDREAFWRREVSRVWDAHAPGAGAGAASASDGAA